MEALQVDANDTYAILEKAWIPADYTKSTVEVYQYLATTLILKEFKNPNPSSHVKSGRTLPNDELPSWVPQWDRTNDVYTISKCIDSPAANASRGLIRGTHNIWYS
jgi:hypothetical protein